MEDYLVNKISLLKNICLWVLCAIGSLSPIFAVVACAEEIPNIVWYILGFILISASLGAFLLPDECETRKLLKEYFELKELSKKD